MSFDGRYSAAAAIVKAILAAARRAVLAARSGHHAQPLGPG